MKPASQECTKAVNQRVSRYIQWSGDAVNMLVNRMGGWVTHLLRGFCLAVLIAFVLFVF